MWFLAPDDGSGGGSQTSTVARILGEPGDQPKDPNDDGSAGGEGGGGNLDPTLTPTTPTPTLVDAADLAKQFGEVLGQHFKPVPGENGAGTPAKPLTPEEIAKAQKDLNFWEPDDAWLARYDNLETRRAAILEMRDGQMKQFVTIARALQAQQNEEWSQRFDPVSKMISERQEAERETRFHMAFPQLAAPELRPVIAKIATDIHASGGFNGLDETKAFAKIATAVEAVAKQFNPNFKLSAGAAASPTKKSTPSSSNGLPTITNGGGGSGGGNGDDRTSGVPKAVALLPRIRN